MEFRILGPLEVVDGRDGVSLDAPKLRVLLAVLLLHPNEVVSSQRLIDELWGERPPATAAKVVRTYVSQLRRGLGPDRIATRAPGYLLRLEEEELDSVRFRRLVAAARRLTAGGDHEQAQGLYREALSLWRGPPLADVHFEAFARNEVDWLEQERLKALTDLIDCELALGRHAEVVPELEKLVRHYPLREQLWAQLMRGLYRAGRQADALSVYQDARRTLAEELGLEPGRELQDLERAILTHDPSLDVRPRTAPATEPLTRPPSAPRRFIRWRAAGLIIGIGLALVVGLAIWGPDEPSVRLAPNSVGLIDVRSGRVTKSFAVGREPRALERTADSVWVANFRDQTVTRIPRSSGHSVTIPAGGHPTDLVAYGGSIWVWTLEGLLVPIDPRFESAGDPIRLESQTPSGLALGGIAAGAGFLWVAAPPRTVFRVELANPRHRLAVVPDAGVQGPIGYRDGAAWVAGFDQLFPIAARTGIAAAGVRVGAARDLVFDAGALWIVSGGPGHLGGVVQALRRLDLRGRLVQATIAVGGNPVAVTAADGSIWTASRSDGVIHRVDPSENRIVDTIQVESSPTALAADENGVWIAVD